MQRSKETIRFISKLASHSHHHQCRTIRLISASSSTPLPSYYDSNSNKYHARETSVSKTVEDKRSFSTRTDNSADNQSKNDDSSCNTATPREQILTAALEHVHQYGWTDDAIAQGVVSSNLPPSYIGRIFASDESNSNTMELISFFMKQCNHNLQQELQKYFQQQSQNQLSEIDILSWAIRKRLEMNLPYIQSNRWHEGMALGAMYPSHAVATASLLEELVLIIDNATNGIISFGGNNSTSGDKMKQAAIGGIYITTELYMLNDTSVNHNDTWSFLNDRIQDYHQLYHNNNFGNSSHILDPTTAAAGMAVASSMGSALLSIASPVAKAGVSSMANVIVPQFLSLLQPPSSTSSPHSSSYSSMQQNPSSSLNRGASFSTTTVKSNAAGINAQDYYQQDVDTEKDEELQRLLSSLPPFEEEEEKPEGKK